MKKSYEERQAEWVKENSLKKGDTVVITRRAKDNEDGWSDEWPPIGDSWNGVKCKVKSIVEDRVQVYNPKAEDWWNFPYFVLKKVDDTGEKKGMKKFYAERQAEWVKKNNLKEGDTVVITRRAKDNEDGWNNVWPPIGASWNGEKCEVKSISPENIQVYNHRVDDWWNFPYFVLKKVQSSKEWTVSFGLKVRTGDQVLVRDESSNKWQYSLFSHVVPLVAFQYYTSGGSFSECIPYAGNEHLVGTCDAYCAEVKEDKKEQFFFGEKVRFDTYNGDRKAGVFLGRNSNGCIKVAAENPESPYGVSIYVLKNNAQLYKN